MKAIPPPKLTIELVPVSSWGMNLSKQLPASKWKILREASYAKAGHACEICGGVGTYHAVECHEIWEFDTDSHTQRLSGLISLCPSCHSVKHFGRACAAGPEYREKAICHLRKVNTWSQKQADAYIKEARAEWIARCKIHWKIDTSLVGLQVDTGAAHGEFLVTDYGDLPKNPDEWTLLGDDYSFGLSFWKHENPPLLEVQISQMVDQVSKLAARPSKSKPIKKKKK